MQYLFQGYGKFISSGKAIDLQNRNLHISGLLNKEKVDIQGVKVDIESVLSAKCSDFTVKTMVHIHRLFEKFGFDGVFGRSAVMELLELKSSSEVQLVIKKKIKALYPIPAIHRHHLQK